MKFELVGFYPITDKNRSKSKKNTIGSVHIYVVDCQLDLRGIKVIKNGKSIYFLIPHLYGIDYETGENVKYPIFRWTKESDHNEMMDFLHKEVKPIIKQTLNNLS